MERLSLPRETPVLDLAIPERVVVNAGDTSLISADEGNTCRQPECVGRVYEIREC